MTTWIRTNDLRVMSPTSYQTAPFRINKPIKKSPKMGRELDCSGSWIRTNDLRVMSPTSYQTAPSRKDEILKYPATEFLESLALLHEGHYQRAPKSINTEEVELLNCYNGTCPNKIIHYLLNRLIRVCTIF